MDKYTEVLKTVVRVFIAYILASAIDASTGLFEMDSWNEWEPVIAGATVAALTVVVKALDPSADEYGIGSK